MKRIITLFIQFALCLHGSVFAQDQHLSQFYASPLQINPALTGMFTGDYRGVLQYRTQWNAITANPFVTAHSAYDQPYKKDPRFGFGGYILNNRAGAGNLNALNVILSGAYEITIDPEKRHRLTTGLQLGIIQKSVNVNALTFDKQYSLTYNGGDFDPGLDNGEAFNKSSFVMPDVSFGVYYSYENKNRTLSPYIGFSGFHLTQPKETFFGNKEYLPLRFVVWGGSKIIINPKISAEPNFLFMRQKNNNEINIGALAYYYLEDSDASFFIGPYYRNKDAVVLHTGVLYKKTYRLGLSYDINVSSLKPVSRGRGGFEISITYNKPKTGRLPSIL